MCYNIFVNTKIKIDPSARLPCGQLGKAMT